MVTTLKSATAWTSKVPVRKQFGAVKTAVISEAEEQDRRNYISNVFTTSGGAGAYISGSIEQLARP